MTRSAISRIGAPTPMAEWLGSKPMRPVAAAMSRMVMASTDLRPMRSPSGPQTMPPTGRRMNEIANPSRVPRVPSSPGKKASVRYVAVAA